jgi:hypothetical protein
VIELFALLLAALFATAPVFPHGMTPTCLLVTAELAQARPCKPEELPR